MNEKFNEPLKMATVRVWSSPIGRRRSGCTWVTQFEEIRGNWFCWSDWFCSEYVQSFSFNSTLMISVELSSFQIDQMNFGPHGLANLPGIISKYSQIKSVVTMLNVMLYKMPQNLLSLALNISNISF